MNIAGFLNIALQLGMIAATGGAAAPAVMAQQAAMQAAVAQAIQILGQEMGIPQQFIDMAKMAALSQMGGANSDIGSVNFSEKSPVMRGIIDNGHELMHSFTSDLDNVGRGNWDRNMSDLVSSGRGLARGLETQESGLYNRQMSYENQATAARARGDTKSADRFDAMAEGVQSQRIDLNQMLSDLNLQNNLKKLERQTKDIVGNGKLSIIMKLAMIMGMIADQKMQDMMDKAMDLGNFGKVSQKNQGKFQQLNAELQGLSQELNVVSQASANVIKSIGEAGAALARKS